MTSVAGARKRPSRVTAATVTLLVAAFLAIPATASAAAFSARLHAPNHTPTIKKLWPITITVTKNGTKLSGHVHYQFLFQGQVESTQPGRSFTRGLYKDSLLFPPQSLGVPLTLKIIIKTRYGTVSIPWTVTSKKA